MNRFQQTVAAGAMALGVLLPMPSIAQAPSGSPTAQGAQPASMTAGEIRKVDRDNGKVTIRHGDIRHLDMPGMTMVFTATDKGLLANIKPGDQVTFMAVNDGGKMIVTDLRPAN